MEWKLSNEMVEKLHVRQSQIFGPKVDWEKGIERILAGWTWI